jgi:hypothetical protein
MLYTPVYREINCVARVIIPNNIIYSQVVFPRPQLMCDYPLNLSILIRGGKETKWDSLSSGERNGISPARRVACLIACRPIPCTGGPTIFTHISIIFKSSLKAA